MKKKNLIGIFANASTLRNFRKKMRSFIAQGLEDEFTFQFTSNNPDYIVYDVYNCDHLDPKYNDTIKIAIYTENKIILKTVW